MAKKRAAKPSRRRVKAAAKSPARKASAKQKPKKKKPATKPKAAPAAKPSIALVDAIWRGGTHAEEIGEMEIPSGKVKVSDAGTLFAPVEVAVPKGSYHVRITRNDDGENRAAVLIQKDAVPTTWTERGSYAVDAGMSGFFDGDVFTRVDKHVWPISIYDDLICNHLDPAEREGHAGAFVPYEETKFSACRSGYGDGVYPVYEGRDANGTVVAVVTTFLD
jgi:hypothetical protein